MKRWLMTSLIVATIALIAAGCGGDDDDQVTSDLSSDIAALRTELAQTRAIATEALIRASLPALSAARFHEIDERINNEGRVDPADPGFLQRAQQVLASAAWPVELRPNIEQFRAALLDAGGPVLDNDAEAAAPLVRILHTHAHEFEGAVAAYFAGDAIPPPPRAGAAEHEHVEDDAEDHPDGEE